MEIEKGMDGGITSYDMWTEGPMAPISLESIDIRALTFLTLFEFFSLSTTTCVHPVKLGTHLDRLSLD